MKIAIDARILVRSRARRTLLGAAELCEAQVVVPETALAMAKLHYPTMSAAYVRKTLQWDDVMAGKRTSDEAMGLRVHDATQTLGIGFARWLDEEKRRHDGVFTEAPQTRRGQGVAMELSGAGAVDKPRDGRWGVGGGPYVIAEALEAGAHWVASGNFRTLESGVMELWLDEAQARGRYTHVPRPFVLTAEQALRKMIERTVARRAPPERAKGCRPRGKRAARYTQGAGRTNGNLSTLREGAGRMRDDVDGRGDRPMGAQDEGRAHEGQHRTSGARARRPGEARAGRMSKENARVGGATHAGRGFW